MTISLISREVSQATTIPADLAELDAIGDLHQTIEHAQTGIADVVDRSLRTDPDAGGHAACRRGFEILAADRAVRSGAEIVGPYVRDFQGTPGRRDGPVRNTILFFPPSSFEDSRQRFQLPLGQVQRRVNVLEASLELQR